MKEYDNIRDYSTRSFYMGLLSVRHSPSLLLLTLDANSYNENLIFVDKKVCSFLTEIESMNVADDY